jgi:hypothetical protein
MLLSATEGAGALKVAVVNQTLVTKFLNCRDPKIRESEPTGADAEGAAKEREFRCATKSPPNSLPAQML